MYSLQLPIELGIDLDTNEPLFFDRSALATHLHLIGATGTGKTSALETLLYELWVNGDPDEAYFCIDLLGGLSDRLLRFIANPDFCDDSIRHRLVYYEPAREQYATTLHPLQFGSRANQDYQVERTMDLLLRGFEDNLQSPTAKPRMRLWLYRALVGLALMGFPLAVSRYLLHPRLDEHRMLLAMLPRHEQAEWNEILKDSKTQAAIILEAARNRVSIISDYILVQRMFSSVTNRFDIDHFVEEGRIVIVNLSAGAEQLSFQAANMIGSLIVNEVFHKCLSRYAIRRKPSNVFLVADEFHRLLGGPEIIDFLPLVRNLGLKLILAHQSFSQLDLADVDLRPLIAQARSRLMFANDFMDADLLAEEVANFKWDPDEIKRTYESYRQRIAGYRKVTTESWGNTFTGTKSWTDQQSTGRGVQTPDDPLRKGSTSRNTASANVAGGSKSQADSHSCSEHFLPIHEDFSEVVRVDYRSREEVVHKWRRNIRKFNTGECLVKLANDPELYRVLVNYLPQYDDPGLDRAVEELIARNYEEGPFITAAEADRELEEIRQKILRGPRLTIPSPHTAQSTRQQATEEGPFRG